MKTLKEAIFNKVNLTSEEWEDFSGKWIKKTFSKGEYITQKGQTERYIYFVEEGVQRAFHIRKGEEICVAFSFDHSLSGVYDSFLTQTSAKYYLQAISSSVLLALHYDDLQEMYHKYKNIERWGRLVNQDILVGKANREVAILSYSAEERYKRLMTQSPRCIQLIPQKYLASYLAMTPETFSRLRSKVRL